MDGEKDCKLSSFILWEESSRHYSNDVIICTVNTISAVFAFFCNLAIIVTIKKKNLIQTPRDILIGSLTFLDCIVPLVAKPLFIALRMSLHDDHVTCSRLQQLTKATELAVMFGCGCSLTHIVLIAGDRYLALRKPIKYRRPRTKKVAITFACTCWAIWSLIVIIFDKIIPRRFENFLRIFIATVLLTSLVFLKVKAFLIVYRFNHTLIHDRNSLKVEGLTERDRKVLIDTTFISITFMLLFIPTAALIVIRPAGIYGNVVFPWSMTTTLLNSLINPMIHVWRNRLLRRAILDLLTTEH